MSEFFDNSKIEQPRNYAKLLLGAAMIVGAVVYIDALQPFEDAAVIALDIVGKGASSIHG